MKGESNWRHFINIPTIRLAAIYLAIIMLMSISFSVIFYNTSSKQLTGPQQPITLQNPLPNSGVANLGDQIRNEINNRLKNMREELILKLVWINIGTLFIGSAISYLLARWSLKPIEESMEAQSRFISDASHELRTPLTVLQTSNEVALRKKKLTMTEAKALIKHNVEEVRKLRDLSNMLLNLLKNIDSPTEQKVIKLQDVVSDAMSSVVTIAQEKNITIEDTVPNITVFSNQLLLGELLSILLDNAIKYSGENTQITVSSRQSNKITFVTVTDQGIGIRASDLPFIFRRFYRADKSRNTEDSSGYGLGLSIADKIARQINAKITVKSEPDKGSVFTIALPTDSK